MKFIRLLVGFCFLFCALASPPAFASGSVAPPLSSVTIAQGGGQLAIGNSKKVLFVGDSFFDTYGCISTSSVIQRRSSSGPAWFQVLSGEQFYGGCTTIDALQGAKSAYILNTLNGGLEAQLIAQKPGLVIWEPGTNDWQEASYNVTIANDLAVMALCKKYGAKLIFATLPPRGAFSDAPTTAEDKRRRQGMLMVNLERMKAAQTVANVATADITPGWADGTNTNFNPRSAAVQGDSLHPGNGDGGYEYGSALWKAAQSLGYNYLPPIRGYSYLYSYDATNNPYGNRLSNQNFYATSSAVNTRTAGTFPTGWAFSQIAGTACTATGSQIPDPEGYAGTAHQFAMACSGTSSTNEQWDIEETIGNVAPGDVIVAQVQVAVTASTGMRVPQLRVICSGGASYEGWEFESTGSMRSGVTWKGVLSTEPFSCPTGTTTVKMRVVWTLDGSNSANTGTFVVSSAYLGTPYPAITVP